MITAIVINIPISDINSEGIRLPPASFAVTRTILIVWA